jgi:hypothetical protein
MILSEELRCSVFLKNYYVKMPDPGRRKEYVTCMVIMQKNNIEENPGNGPTIFLHKYTVFLSVFVNQLLAC